uniref:Uncharacterized protein n=1 Tax=Chromera velia CCMP2878 TaxID=1169474 RepID=A0A0G4I2W4_9ALVE|eukprot:Cvel_10448.t1-p1 / transcript=Cvel_10448.t1 / gene=Cvel_10448 / organism=Chromera_velia_CCMP2878 / gene_product=Protein cfxQ homolog, putative / transcript_product=Protein cfxQ homolog, putative / location=Cvel_scaffold629:43240-44271(-) / protein_length=344 / sequence_SO=supercontig / SO=protein_coding / is_pseudo=false
MEEATGGVLFIDEAYALGDGQYGREALEKLLSLLTSPEYDGDKTIVILAGYTAEMQRMLQRNQGLASRFKTTVSFPDWSPADCVSFFCEKAQMQQDIEVPEAMSTQLVSMFERMGGCPGWANARDAINFLDRALVHRASRVASLPAGSEASTPSFSVSDCAAAVDDLMKTRPASAGNNRNRSPHQTGRETVFDSEAASQRLVPNRSRPQNTVQPWGAAPGKDDEAGELERVMGGDRESPFFPAVDAVFSALQLTPQQQADAVAAADPPSQVLQQLQEVLKKSRNDATQMWKEGRGKLLERIRRAVKEDREGVLSICPVCGRNASQCPFVQRGAWAAVSVPEQMG